MISPAERKEIEMIDTAALDCITVVETTPKQILFQSLSVVLRRSFSSTPPVNILNPSSIASMPNIKIATPAEISRNSGLTQNP